jgi:hypothetical protein
MMRFKDWIQNETMTSTGCVAGFSRIAIPLVFRQWPPAIAADLECGRKDKKKKKVKPQPQVKESFFFEGMMTPANLPPGVSVRVLHLSQDRIFKVSDGNGELGRLKLRKMQDDLWCPHCKASQGYGPFLYDLAIEYATMNGRGVLPATGADLIYKVGCYNTDDSNSVWKYYFEKRGDVQHHLHEKTPKYGTFFNRAPMKPERNPKNVPWLYCIYTKQPTMTQQLRNMGKLVDTGSGQP